MAGDDSRVTGAYTEGRITISTGNPSGGANKDLWLKV